MEQRAKVIFDTNELRNEMSADVFLGNRTELQRFLAVADIFIPEVVIEEVREQKRLRLEERQTSFLENVFHKLRGVDEQETKDFNIEAHIEGLENDEDIPYTTIRLTDHSVLPKIKDLAIKRQAPFAEGKDSGFKDVYIYFTVIEFINANNDPLVYFVTQDKRLTEAFVNIPRVQVVRDFEDFQKYRLGYFKEEYFIGAVNTHLSDKYNEETAVSATHVKDTWLNTGENWVVKVATEDDIYFIEVDFSNKEIVGSTNVDFTKGVEFFVNARSFERVHSLIEKLTPYTKYFSDEDIKKIIEASVTNSQIYWIATDEDVIAFVKPLFESKLGIIPEDIQNEYKRYYE